MQLVKAIQNQFGIVVDPQTGANTQIAFDLCYDYVIQSSAGVYTENVNALYGLCRSMIVVSPVLGVLSALRWGASGSRRDGGAGAGIRHGDAVVREPLRRLRLPVLLRDARQNLAGQVTGVCPTIGSQPP